DGRDSFEGYSDEEITEILQQRYDIGKVDAILRNGEKLTIKADGITFCGTNHLPLHETYRQEKFKAFTESIFGEHLYRGLSWKTEEGKEVTDITYITIIGYNGAPGREDLEWFCDDICLWLEDCYAEYPYEEFGNLYHCIIPDLYGSEEEKYYFGDFPMRNFEEDESILYNELYHYLNDLLSKTGGQGDAGQIPADSGETDAAYDTAEDVAYEDADKSGSLITPEMVEEWASWPADAVYEPEEGGEYAMIPIDRALGSSFYILMFYEKKGKADTASLISSDPFRGSIGEVSFLTFLGDGQTGFSCLTHSGGSYGELFRTDNGGKSFASVSLPSPEIALPDGKNYNPFVMPEQVWEEDGAIYLLAGQGPDGDYHDPALEGWPVGIYVSHDGGKSFAFLEARER
ncbi:MAG: hypothetical protein K6A92_13115, partial [Lachnospiraceae bacterium]|nr:hypothetical protein [Lachnospiraceae bacterium]